MDKKLSTSVIKRICVYAYNSHNTLKWQFASTGCN